MRWARDLQDTQDRLFWDDDLGGYFYSQANAPNVIIRLKDDHDGAEPCGNSVAAKNLLILSSYFEHLPYIDKVVKLFEVNVSSNPFSFVLPEMFSALLLYETYLTMLVIVGEYSNAGGIQVILGIRVFHIIPTVNAEKYARVFEKIQWNTICK